MDVIERFIAQHKAVKERLDILEKITKMIDSDTSIWDNVHKMSGFFDKEVKEHFHLEEEVLFPIIRRKLPSDKQKILTEIEAEHKPILKKLDEFKEMSAKHKKLSSRISRENFIKISMDIIESMITHANKEDEKLFPIAKEFLDFENYKELEQLYFKYLNI
ncbi:MAG: hypothetical protein A2539_04345 [Elusimicrobia bacterium RIFOXYD2_FULL_34_15]|nr:MAG: hypothetical protein A2539_04345 [Elusimicrobia bacterium RIFOXYD2_FULL_34_15]